MPAKTTKRQDSEDLGYNLIKKRYIEIKRFNGFTI